MFNWIGNLYRNKMQAKAAKKGLPIRHNAIGASSSSYATTGPAATPTDGAYIGDSYLYGSSLSLHGLSDSQPSSWSGGGGESGGGGASASWSDSCSSSGHDSSSSSSYDSGSSDSGTCGGGE